VLLHANNLTAQEIESGVEEDIIEQTFVYDVAQYLVENNFEKV
jgi:hypothetical protein